jgi:hypothetical protein
VARYGGEEFVIVMPQTELAGACTFAERLRAQVANRLTVTVSGGVAEVVDGDTPEALFIRADTALYSAKNAGRNRIFYRAGDDTQQVAPEKAEQQRTPWVIDAGQAPSGNNTQPVAPEKSEEQRTPWVADPGQAKGASANISHLSLGDGPGVGA